MNKNVFKDSLNTERTTSNNRNAFKEFSQLARTSHKSKSKSKTKKSETHASNGNFIVINFLNSMESVDSAPLVNIVVQKNKNKKSVKNLNLKTTRYLSNIINLELEKEMIITKIVH